MKKYYNIFMLILVVILVLPIASATFSLSNYATPINDGSKYGKIDVYDGNLIMPDEKIKTFTLVENTEQCLIDCHASGEVTLLKEGNLFDDVKFNYGNIKTSSITLVNGEEYNIDIPDYNDICSTIPEEIDKNGTTIKEHEECISTKTGTHTETRTRDILYNGNILPAGNYSWRIDGKKNPKDKIDWVINSNGVDLDSWAWWDGSWTYKKAINITGSVIANYSLYLEINKTASMNATYDDLRFVDNTETTELPYFIENNTNSTTAFVWVKVQDNSTFYMYYGNSIVGTTSNIYPTFIWADNFDGTSLSANWTNLYSATIAVGGGELNLSGTNCAGLITAISTHNSNKTITDYKLHLEGGTGVLRTTIFTAEGNAQFGSGCQPPTVPARAIDVDSDSGGDNYFRWWSGAASTALWSIVGSSADVYNYHTIGIGKTGTSADSYKDYVKKATNNSLSSSGDVNDTYISFYNNNNNVERRITFDWIRTRVYLSTIPTVTFGVEQLKQLNSSLTISTTLNAPVDYTNTTQTSITFNSSVSITGGSVINATLWFNDTGYYNTTALTPSTNFSNLSRSGFTDGTYKWNVEYCANNATSISCNFASANRTFTIDTTAPTISIIYPSNNSIVLNSNLSLNYTSRDNGAGLETCKYSLDNSANITLASCANNTFVGTNIKHTLILYANDTLGNEASNTTIFWIHNYTNVFSSIVLEGADTTFNFNVQTTNLTTYGVNLTYNGTIYPMTFISNNGTDYRFNKTLTLPYVTSETIKTFNITYFLNGNQFESINYNQTIGVFAVDNCTTFGVPLFNLTAYDEDNLAKLDGSADNVSIKVDFTFKTLGGTTILNYSNISQYANPYTLCFNNSLGSTSYRVDGIIEYSALGRFQEFHHLQNFTLTNSTSVGVLLYDLNSTKGEEYKITYKDSNFVPVVNAILDIQRKYINEGLFRTIERPKTGAEGYTISHLITNDIIYNILVYKEGVLLATFESIIPTCQNPTLQTCEINLNSYGSATMPTDFTNENDLTFNLKYNSTTKTVSSTYTITSGSSSVVTLNVTKYDLLGNTSVCADSLTASGGTLSCNISSSFGNTTVIGKLYKDGVEVGLAIINMKQDPNDIYGGSLIFIAMLIFLVVIGIGATSDSPMTMGITIAIGSIVLVALNLIYSPSFIGAGATILWFLVVIGIVLIKGSNRQ